MQITCATKESVSFKIISTLFNGVEAGIYFSSNYSEKSVSSNCCIKVIGKWIWEENNFE